MLLWQVHFLLDVKYRFFTQVSISLFPISIHLLLDESTTLMSHFKTEVQVLSFAFFHLSVQT